MGPVAKPRTYNDTPRVPTSRLMPWMAIIEGMAEEKIALAPATIIVERERMTDMKSLVCLLVYVTR